MRRLAFLAPALAALTLMAPPRARAEPPEPATLSTMADELQRLQTQIAEGDRSAYPTEMDALKAMAEAISAAKPETWADRREADALVIYVFSGGSLARRSPHQGRQARRVRTRACARSARLCDQSRGRGARASRPRDLTALDVRLAGRIAFARSVLKTRNDPKAAIADLDWARLLAPGGLVEEAALRREIALLAEAHDAPRVASSAGNMRSVSRPRFTRRIFSTISPGSSRGRGSRTILRISVSSRRRRRDCRPKASATSC